MSLKRELCDEHAKELRATKLFGGKPAEESITHNPALLCGSETMQLYGKTTQKRVNSCNKPAEYRFAFGEIVAVEQ